MSDETVRVPAALVDALRALADEMEDPNAERGTMPGVRMHVRRVWAARLRTVLGAFAARAVVDAAERPDEGEGGLWGDKSQETATPHDTPPLTASPAPVSEPNVYGEGNTGPDLSDRLIALVDEWEAEIDEHTKAGEFGIAEGLRVAMEAVHALTVTPALLSSPRRTRDEGSEDEAEAAWIKWLDDDVKRAVPQLANVSVKSAFVAGFRAARLAGEDDR